MKVYRVTIYVRSESKYRDIVLHASNIIKLCYFLEEYGCELVDIHDISSHGSGYEQSILSCLKESECSLTTIETVCEQVNRIKMQFI